MKKSLRFIALLGLILSSVELSAQAPGWTVDESRYEYSMTFIAKININGEVLRSSSDIVGAFVNGVCRGVANPTYIAASDAYYVYLTIFSNRPGETVEFRIYRADTDEIIDINTTIDFESNQHIGSRFQSYVIAEPPLRSEADLISFGFSGVVADSLNINGNALDFYVPSSVDITGLTPIFTFSEGANAFVNQVAQTSGVGTRDFSSPVNYQIMSENEANLNEYRISVFNSAAPDSGGGEGGDEGSDDPNQLVFTLSESDNSSVVSENGSTDNFIIVLFQEPENQVVFTVTSSDPDEVRVLSSEITFTSDNWNFAQFVQLQGVDDDLRDGDQESTISVAIDYSRSDVAFSQTPSQTLRCINTDDDDIPGIIVEETNGSTQVDESQSEDTIFVRLATEPATEVVIDVLVSDPTEVSTRETQMTFTADNWGVPQSLTVIGVDDTLNDGSQRSNVILSINDEASDDSFDALADIAIEVTTTDNDASGNDDGNDDGDDAEQPEDEVDPPLFYKRDAVCYNGGQIKVEYEVEGTNVIVNFQGSRLDTDTISGGEVIFTDLERGTYVLEIANFVKVVNIGLDE